MLEKRFFGTTSEGAAVDCWTLTAGGYQAEILTRGGILRQWLVPMPNGTRRDIVLGCDTMAQYEAQTCYFGALIGRVCNRIGGASFSLGGQEYPLAANDGGNCLHGGLVGFDRVIWQAEADGESLVLTHTSPAGDEGFPGELRVRAVYTLTADGVLTLTMNAETTADTLCSLTNHSYFNLGGHDSGVIEGQSISIPADVITETRSDTVPTGKLLRVAGTPYELHHPQDIMTGVRALQQTRGVCGYDDNFVLSSHGSAEPRHAATAEGKGIRLTCETTSPGLQFYTANYLDGECGKDGACYGRNHAFCLEAQAWPDAVHHPAFPSIVLRPGETYRQVIRYRAEVL